MRGVRLGTVPDNTPHPSHGKCRGPLTSPRRGEGPRSTIPLPSGGRGSTQQNPSPLRGEGGRSRRRRKGEGREARDGARQRPSPFPRQAPRAPSLSPKGRGSTQYNPSPLRGEGGRSRRRRKGERREAQDGARQRPSPFPRQAPRAPSLSPEGRGSTQHNPSPLRGAREHAAESLAPSGRGREEP